MLVLSGLVVKRGHTELLMNQILGLSSRRSASIVGIVAEMRLIYLLLLLRHKRINTADKAVIL